MIDHRSVTFGPDVDAVEAARMLQREGNSLRLLGAYVAAEEELIRVRAERDRLLVSTVELRAAITDRLPAKEIPISLAVMRSTDLPTGQIAEALAEHDRREREGVGS